MGHKDWDPKQTKVDHKGREGNRTDQKKQDTVQTQTDFKSQNTIQNQINHQDWDTTHLPHMAALVSTWGKKVKATIWLPQEIL